MAEKLRLILGHKGVHQVGAELSLDEVRALSAYLVSWLKAYDEPAPTPPPEPQSDVAKAASAVASSYQR